MPRSNLSFPCYKCFLSLFIFLYFFRFVDNGWCSCNWACREIQIPLLAYRFGDKIVNKNLRSNTLSTVKSASNPFFLCITTEIQLRGHREVSTALFSLLFCWTLLWCSDIFAVHYQASNDLYKSSMFFPIQPIWRIDQADRFLLSPHIHVN